MWRELLLRESKGNPFPIFAQKQHFAAQVQSEISQLFLQLGYHYWLITSMKWNFPKPKPKPHYSILLATDQNTVIVGAVGIVWERRGQSHSKCSRTGWNGVLSGYLRGCLR